MVSLDYKKKIFAAILLTLVVFICIFAFYNKSENVKNIDGKIVFTAEDGLYSLTIQEGDERWNIYYQNDGYDKYSYIDQLNGNIICVAHKKLDNRYVLLKLENGKTQEIMSSEKDIFSPVINENENSVIYIEESDSVSQKGSTPKSYLYQYDINKKIKKQIFFSDVDKRNNIMVLLDGTIIFKAKLCNKIYNDFSIANNSLLALKKDGEIVELKHYVNTANWKDINGSLVLTNEKGMYSYDLSSGYEKKIIDSKYSFHLQGDRFIVSPNGKYIFGYFSKYLREPDLNVMFLDISKGKFTEIRDKTILTRMTDNFIWIL